MQVSSLLRLSNAAHEAQKGRKKKKPKHKKNKKKEKKGCLPLPTLLVQFPKAAGSFAWPCLATDHTNGATPQTCLQKIDESKKSSNYSSFIASLE
jgi:hypothetical protein